MLSRLRIAASLGTYVVMAYIVMALYSYGLHRYGPYGAALPREVLVGDLTVYGLYSYGAM